jgi:hypothetical protein
MASPLTRTTTHVDRWQCQACTEWYTSPPVFPYEDRHHCKFCSGCIRSQFDAALEFEVNWPASWGSIELIAEDYASILSPDTLTRYQWKKRAMDDYAASTVAEGIEGLVRGKDFQNCPKCHTVIHLETGCNHMTCKCTENFCFLCGEPAGDDSGHWERDGCPRYNHTHHVPQPLNDEERAERDRLLRHYIARQAEEDAEVERRTARLEAQRQQELTVANTLDFVRWAWNVAMQYSDATLRHHMRGFTRPQVNSTMPDLPARRHWGPVMTALRAYNPAHGVTEAHWAASLAAGVEWASPDDYEDADDDETVPAMLRTFLFRMIHNEHEGGIDNHRSRELLLPLRPNYHVLSEAAFLRQPVGGVFNFSNMEERFDAARWIASRINLPAADWPRLNHPDNFAILTIGPGEDPATSDDLPAMTVAMSGRNYTEATRVHFRHAQRNVTFLLVAQSTILMQVYQDGEQDREDEVQNHLAAWIRPRGVPSEAAHDVALLAWLTEFFTAPQEIFALQATLRGQWGDARPMVRINPWTDDDDNSTLFSEPGRADDGESNSGDSGSEDIHDTRSDDLSDSHSIRSASDDDEDPWADTRSDRDINGHLIESESYGRSHTTDDNDNDSDYSASGDIGCDDITAYHSDEDMSDWESESSSSDGEAPDPEVESLDDATFILREPSPIGVEDLNQIDLNRARSAARSEQNRRQPLTDLQQEQLAALREPAPLYFLDLNSEAPVQEVEAPGQEVEVPGQEVEAPDQEVEAPDQEAESHDQTIFAVQIPDPPVEPPQTFLATVRRRRDPIRALADLVPSVEARAPPPRPTGGLLDAELWDPYEQYEREYEQIERANWVPNAREPDLETLERRIREFLARGRASIARF